MYKTKLLALDYPNKQFNVEDTKQVRSLVLWLEDQKIRDYKIEDRKGLRDIDSKTWDEHFATYLKHLNCPIMTSKLKGKLEWLIGYAISLEYSDNVEKYGKQTSDNVKKNETAAPKMVSSNPLDNLDFESPEFKNFVNDLAKMLHVTQHPDHLMTLQAVSKLITDRLNTRNAQSLQEGEDNSILEKSMGINIKDKNLNKAAKVLKLLYIQDLRDMQTKINETIVAVQKVTADPITDTKIGKVGY